MNKTVKYIMLLLFVALSSVVLASEKISLQSPNKKLTLNIEVGDQIAYSIDHDGQLVLDNSVISMQLSENRKLGVKPSLAKTSKKSVDETIDAIIYKKSKIENIYNEVTLDFKGDYSVIFRAYNDGVAYRFVVKSKKPFLVEDEQAEFNFPNNPSMYVGYVKNTDNKTLEEQMFNSFENIYTHTSLSDWNKQKLAFSPLLVEASNGKKLCIVEADLFDYPGMFLYPGDKSQSLKGVFAPYPKQITQGGHNELQGMVDARESYIAKYTGSTSFPWRAIVISDNDMQLANNDMVYKLSTAADPKVDYSWVKPGKVAWDWWNDWNLYGVDFRAGVNNDTYKYYIDFASKFGIEYVILDEGWAVNKKADLFQVVPEIDLEELVAYAKTKNVGIILWAGYYAFDRDMEKVCAHYSKMGVKGFKIDFMDRDDQLMVDFHHRAAQTAAKYQMMVDFHGTYKPTGLHRTYPNVINFEGVYGLETAKFSVRTIDQVTYDVILPFVRQVAGPMDYTQGAMRNAIRDNYNIVNSEAMSQGTRCRQLAEYIIFESPLNMLCDSPSNYLNEEECTSFIANIPTVWDETVALNGKVGEYITIARKKGDVWYVGSMTNWDARTLDIDLSFLGDGNYQGEVFQDGINADRAARDYKKTTIQIPADRKLKVPMASGGGYIIKITTKKTDTK